MRTFAALAIVMVLVGSQAAAQDRLTSPYRHQAETGLRGLDAREIADLKAGNGMGLARAAELNSYPGPRHVLDAISAGQLTATREQSERVQRVFDDMKRDAQRLGGQILDEEQRLEAGFRDAAITEVDLRSRVDRIATLQGQLRAVHLAAHLATRAILSDSQLVRYNELRGYSADKGESEGHQHKH